MTRALIVCTTPRTGGHHLDTLLAEHNLAHPGEYLTPYHDRWDIGRPQLEELWQTHTKAGIFAIRVHWHHRDNSSLLVDWDDLVPPGARGYWLHLHRYNRHAQARSYLTALQTGDWTTPKNGYREFPEPVIQHTARRFARQHADWQRWFRRTHANTMDVNYEMLCDEPDRTLNRISQWLNI